jgi:hypothetical protein
VTAPMAMSMGTLDRRARPAVAVVPSGELSDGESLGGSGVVSMTG